MTVTGFTLTFVGSLFYLAPKLYVDIGVSLCIGGFIIGFRGLQGLLTMISRQEFEIWGSVRLSIVVGMGLGSIGGIFAEGRNLAAPLVLPYLLAVLILMFVSSIYLRKV